MTDVSTARARSGLGDLAGVTKFPKPSATAPNSINHLCQAQIVNEHSKCASSEWMDKVVVGQTQILTDIAGNRLPNVSWVIPTGLASDQPGINDGSGPSWVAQVVNAIGNTHYWANTAILITWDVWGGCMITFLPRKCLQIVRSGVVDMFMDFAYR